MPTTIEAVRAEALFVSSLQSAERPTADQVRTAVSTTIRRLGISGCAALVASEFGDHPETAVPRMGWALTMVRTVYRARRTVRPARMPRPMALAS
jgi:hypothetical protein